MNLLCGARVVAWLCFTLAGALSVQAGYFYVATNGAGGDFKSWAAAAANIQDAVNVATNTGDIVLVSNGVYTTTMPVIYIYNSIPPTTNTSVVCLTNQITLKSVNGPAVTVIDGNYQAITARCVFVSQNAILDGFTVRNGYGDTPSSTDRSGGGIFIYGRATNAGAYKYGGTITNCIIYGNFSSLNGGGISSYNVTSVVANCIIYSNTCKFTGGGMESQYARGPSVINNCVFFGNTCKATTMDYDGGGGLFTYASSFSVKNCLFYRNDSYGKGGAVSLNPKDGFSTFLENCTLIANTASNMAGGLYITNSITALARNSIIWDNHAASNYADAYMTNCNGLTNCCVSDTNGVPNFGVTGSITNNPRFVDVTTNNYRLLSGSPCINAGLNQSWMTNAVDLDGGKRIFNGTVDIGAYEYTFRGMIVKCW